MVVRSERAYLPTSSESDITGEIDYLQRFSPDTVREGPCAEGPSKMEALWRVGEFKHGGHQ